MSDERHSLHQSFDRFFDLPTFFDDRHEFIRNPSTTDTSPHAFCCFLTLDPTGRDERLRYYINNANKSVAVADLVPESFTKMTMNGRPIKAYRIDGQQIVYNDEITTASFLSVVKEYLQTLPFPVRTVAIGTCRE